MESHSVGFKFVFLKLLKRQLIFFFSGWSGASGGTVLFEMDLEVAFSNPCGLFSSYFLNQFDSLIAVKFMAYHFPLPHNLFLSLLEFTSKVHLSGRLFPPPVYHPLTGCHN